MKNSRARRRPALAVTEPSSVTAIEPTDPDAGRRDRDEHGGSRARRWRGRSGHHRAADVDHDAA